MFPSPPPNNSPPTAATAARKTGAIPFSQLSYDNVKKRILTKLIDRVDLSASKRMPASLLRHTLRQQAELLAEVEARSLTKTARDRLIDDILVELFGYGPLDELFADASVREVMVTGPNRVIVRREQEQWMPTNVKFRDEQHVRSILDKIAAHADVVGPVMTSIGAFDMKLPNGFRAIAVIPPEALEQPASAAFIRETPIPTTATASKETDTISSSASTSSDVLKTVAAMPPSSRSGSEDSSASGSQDPLSRYRARILERLTKKFASLGLYDASRLDANELQRIIAAYVSEFATNERIYLSPEDQGRITLEILTALRK